MKKRNTKVEALSESEQEELRLLLEEQETYKKENKILSFYPDTGPLSRKMYPKHITFFQVGGRHKPTEYCPEDCNGSPHLERCVMAANRIGKCNSISSNVETCNGSKTIEELIDRNSPFEVWSWDGRKPVKALASVPFKKRGLHECYRVTLSDGSWVESADLHRILSNDGTWRNASYLYESFSRAPRYSKVRVLDDLHCLRRVQDYLFGSDSWIPDLGGVQLLPALDTGLASFPFADATAGRNPDDRNVGDLGDSDTHRAFLRSCDHCYTNRELPGYLGRFFDLCISNRICVSNARQLFYEVLVSVQRTLATCAFPQLDTERFAVSDQDALAPSSPLLLDAANRIVAVDPIGMQEVFDFEVKGLHNYIAANMVHHNTEGIGAFEMTNHLTGEYPSWWKGHRFNHPISAWAAGDTGQTTRDIIQLKMLGPIGAYGTGMIPKRLLIHQTTKGGMAGAVETIYVRHASGGRSELGLKSFDQGRLAFQGTSKHVIWLDEEPKREVYIECLLRTMKTTTFSGGIILLTFTPLLGMSEVVRDFLGINDTADATPQAWQGTMGEEDTPDELQ
jgi:phage terminase large subunit-like protein